MVRFTLGWMLLETGLSSCGPGLHGGEAASGSEGDPGLQGLGSPEPVGRSRHGEISWKSTTPLNFLRYLGSGEANVVVVDTLPSGWIEREDVAELMPFLRSERPASPVLSSSSSRLSFAMGEKGMVSTVGHEVAYLVQGYRTGRYPPTLGSRSYFSYDPDELESWWRNGGD